MAIPIEFTVKVAEFEPTGIVTVATGSVAAAVLLDDKLITYAKAALPLIVTVPVELAPPRTVVGFSVTVEMPGEALIVKVALADWPFARAPIADVVCARTTVVETVKVAVVAPEATRTVAGTVALEPDADRVTVVPFAGAGPLSVTVAVEVVPPTTAFGLSATDVTIGAVTVRVAL